VIRGIGQHVVDQRDHVEPETNPGDAGLPEGARHLHLVTHPGQMTGGAHHPAVVEHRRPGAEVGRCPLEERRRLRDPSPVEVRRVVAQQRLGLHRRGPAVLERLYRRNVAHRDVDGEHRQEHHGHADHREAEPSPPQPAHHRGGISPASGRGVPR
jgi:hypothetical protein